MRKVCEVSKVPYIGVVAKVQSSGTLSRVVVCIPTVEELVMSTLGAYSCIDSLWRSRKPASQSQSGFSHCGLAKISELAFKKCLFVGNAY